MLLFVMNMWLMNGLCGIDGTDESGKGLDNHHDAEYKAGGCHGEDQAKNVTVRRANSMSLETSTVDLDFVSYLPSAFPNKTRAILRVHGQFEVYWNFS